MPIDVVLLIVTVTTSLFTLILNLVNAIKSNHFASSCCGGSGCVMDVETNMKDNNDVVTQLK